MENWKFAVQVVLAAITLGGIVFAAGKMSGRFDQLESNQVQQSVKIDKVGDVASEAKKAAETANNRLERLEEHNRRIGSLNITRRNRRSSDNE